LKTQMSLLEQVPSPLPAMADGASMMPPATVAATADATVAMERFTRIVERRFWFVRAGRAVGRPLPWRCVA
jgi:hypothetical protein